MPDQLLTSLPQAIDTMLDPADCGPAFLGLPQDVQAMAFDVPDEFLAPMHHAIVRARPDRGQLAAVVDALRHATRPLLLAGGGVHYSFAEAALLSFAERHNIPVVETVAGKASLAATHPLNCGPIGVTGCESANALAIDADVVVSVGSRLEDFTTGSWTLFQHPGRHDHRTQRCSLRRAQAPVASLRRRCPRWALRELSDALGDWRRQMTHWTERAASERAGYHAYIDKIAAPSDDSSRPMNP